MYISALCEWSKGGAFEHRLKLVAALCQQGEPGPQRRGEIAQLSKYSTDTKVARRDARPTVERR